jgi:hypothetical protein
MFFTATSNRKDLGLIVDELRLLQGMILKSGHKDDLVRRIHILIKNIEKRAGLKVTRKLQ